MGQRSEMVLGKALRRHSKGTERETFKKTGRTAKKCGKN